MSASMSLGRTRGALGPCGDPVSGNEVARLIRSCTASCTCSFLPTSVRPTFFTCSACRLMKEASVNDSSVGRSASSVLPTLFITRSTRFSAMSLMFATSSSSLSSPPCTWCLNASMFSEFQDSVTMPGRSFASISAKCGASSPDVTGCTIASTRSYSASMYSMSL